MGSHREVVHYAQDFAVSSNAQVVKELIGSGPAAPSWHNGRAARTYGEYLIGEVLSTGLRVRCGIRGLGQVRGPNLRRAEKKHLEKDPTFREARKMGHPIRRSDGRSPTQDPPSQTEGGAPSAIHYAAESSLVVPGTPGGCSKSLPRVMAMRPVRAISSTP
jgi:hypothetical protein